MQVIGDFHQPMLVSIHIGLGRGEYSRRHAQAPSDRESITSAEMSHLYMEGGPQRFSIEHHYRRVHCLMGIGM